MAPFRPSSTGSGGQVGGPAIIGLPSTGHPPIQQPESPQPCPDSRIGPGPKAAYWPA